MPREVVRAQETDDKVGRDEPSRLVDEHDAVGVPVKADPEACLFPHNTALEIRQVLFHEGIGRVVGESSVLLLVHERECTARPIK